MWTFCLRSLVREYGWRFVRRVAVRHPWRTLKAFRHAGSLNFSGVSVDVPGPDAGGPDAGRGAAVRPPSLVGVGFCLKPIDPPCPSGRANHDCSFLERLTGADGAGVPAPCRQCAVREIGAKTLRAGSALYVMTSARDVLDDVFVPALEGAAFPRGLFVLCRYSFKPFALGLLASGIRGRLLALEQGDCRDYRTWLLADRGIKAEQTTVDEARMGAIGRLLDAATTPPSPARFERRGNVLYPVAVGEIASHADESS